MTCMTTIIFDSYTFYSLLSSYMSVATVGFLETSFVVAEADGSIQVDVGLIGRTERSVLLNLELECPPPGRLQAIIR